MRLWSTQCSEESYNRLLATLPVAPHELTRLASQSVDRPLEVLRAGGIVRELNRDLITSQYIKCAN